MVLYGNIINNNMWWHQKTMPSKSVSYSDEHYANLVSAQPENMNFSEWVEMLEKEALIDRNVVEGSKQTADNNN